MKRYIIVFLVAFCALSSEACDICSAYSSIRPNDFRHSLGMHFNQRALSGEIPSGLKHLGHLNGLFSTDLIEETFSTIELRGRFRFSDRLAVFGVMPYRVNTRFQNGVIRERSEGIGDPTGFVEYSPFLAKSENQIKFVLNLRAGVKLPLGKTHVKYNEKYLDYDFQLGTGSYDVLIGSETYVGSEGLGLVISQLYKKNTKNLTEYQFGDVYTGLTLITKRWKNEKFTYSIGTGVQIEKQWDDTEKNEVVDGTNKTVCAGLFKTDFNYKKIEVYALIAVPLKQEMNELQQLPLKHLAQFGINYLIERK